MTLCTLDCGYGWTEPVTAGFDTCRVRYLFRHPKCPDSRGGTPDFKWQGWSNGGKNKNPTKPLDRNLTPKKPNFRAIKISRKHLTIICRRRSLYCWKILEKKSRGLLNDITRKIDRKISFEYSKNPTLIKLPKQIVAKIFLPKVSRNRKFPPQKTDPAIIPVTWIPEYPPPPHPLGTWVDSVSPGR